MRFSPEARLHLYAGGLRIECGIGHTLLEFRTTSDDTAEIVGEPLAALMR